MTQGLKVRSTLYDWMFIPGTERICEQLKPSCMTHDNGSKESCKS